jgi:hypothetical protein
VSPTDPKDDTTDPRPWERAGAVRRDVEPHRGLALLLLASAAAAACAFACLFGLAAVEFLAEHGPGSAGAPVTPAVAAADAAADSAIGAVSAACAAAASALAGGVWWAATRDLALMAEGRKDPGGRSMTAWARRLSQATVAMLAAALPVAVALANWH